MQLSTIFLALTTAAISVKGGPIKLPTLLSAENPFVLTIYTPSDKVPPADDNVSPVLIGDPTPVLTQTIDGVMSGTTMLQFTDLQEGAVWRSSGGTMREIGVVKISSPTMGDDKLSIPVEFFVDDAKLNKHHKVSLEISMDVTTAKLTPDPVQRDHLWRCYTGPSRVDYR
jgi:hypothetical protein